MHRAQINAQLTPGRRTRGLGDGSTPTTQGWLNLAQVVGNGVKQGLVDLKNRPPPNAAPADINAWLNSVNGVLLSAPGGAGPVALSGSPYFLYPEFGWTVTGSTATASYNLAPGDNVTWTATDDGKWSYHHVWGGINLDTIINDVASSLAILADVGGFVFLGMFLNTAQAIANHVPLSDLGAQLKNDWATMQNSALLAYSIYDGDWQTAWNAATKYGQDLSGIVAAWSPMPAPDYNGNLTITSTSSPSGAPLTPGQAGGVYVPPPPTGLTKVGAKGPASSSSSSVASNVAIGAVATVAAGLLGAVVYARVKRQPVKTVLKTAWSKTGGRVHVPHIHIPRIHIPGTSR